MLIVLLKNEKKSLLKKDARRLKLLDIARDRRKTLKRENEKRKMEKSQTATILFYFYIFTFLYRKIYVLLKNTFGKT